MLSERQLAEFTMLGKFKLGQIRCWIQRYFLGWHNIFSGANWSTKHSWRIMSSISMFIWTWLEFRPSKNQVSIFFHFAPTAYFKDPNTLLHVVWVKKYMNGICVKNKFERISVYYSGALVGGRGVNVFLCTFVASKSINMCQLRSAKWLYFFDSKIRCILAYFISSNWLILE